MDLFISTITKPFWSLLTSNPAEFTDVVATLNLVFHLFQYCIYRKMFGQGSDDDEENDGTDDTKGEYCRL